MPLQKVIIIGAGIAGPVLALLLKQLHISSVLYEIRNAPGNLGGALNITSNGLVVLDKIGVYEHLKQHCAETLDAEIFNKDGKRIGVSTYGRYLKKKYGYGTLRVMRTILQTKLLERLKEEGIEVKYGMKLTEIEELEDGVKVSFLDGTQDEGDMLVGADGIHSAVRQLHVDPSIQPEYSGLSTLYAILPTKDLVSPIYFADSFNMITFTRGAFGMVYVNPEHSAAYWYNSHEIPSRDRDGWIAHGEDANAIKQEIIERVSSITVPLVKEVIEKAPEIRFFPIYSIPLDGKWYTQKAILIGDAAHALSPHMGQGTSMALEDVYMLYRVLQESDDLSKVFGKYETIRRPRIEDMYKMSKRGGGLRKEFGPWGEWFKETVMWVVMGLTPESIVARPFDYDVTTVKINPPL